MQAQSVEETAKAEQKLTRALADVKAVAENYPELRATENFQQLSRNLSELEDEIQASRRIYNSNVQSYNTDIEQFPGSIIANQGNFTKREFFEIEDPPIASRSRSASTNRAALLRFRHDARRPKRPSGSARAAGSSTTRRSAIPTAASRREPLRGHPQDWFCPVCGARTSDFRPLEPGEA